MTAWGMAGLENNQSSSLTLSHALSLSLTHTQRLCFPESLLKSPRGPWDCVCVCACTHTRMGGGGMGVPLCSPRRLSPCSTWGSCWQCFLSLSFPSVSTCPRLTLRVSLETGEEGPVWLARKQEDASPKAQVPKSPVRDPLALCFLGSPRRPA